MEQYIKAYYDSHKEEVNNLFSKEEHSLIEKYFDGDICKLIKHSGGLVSLFDTEDIIPINFQTNTGEEAILTIFFELGWSFYSRKYYITKNNTVFEVKGSSSGLPYMEKIDNDWFEKSIKDFSISLVIEKPEIFKIWAEFAKKANEIRLKIIEIIDNVTKKFLDGYSETEMMPGWTLKIRNEDLIRWNRWMEYKINDISISANEIKTESGRPSKWFKDKVGVKGKEAKKLLEIIYSTEKEMRNNIERKMKEAKIKALKKA